MRNIHRAVSDWEQITGQLQSEDRDSRGQLILIVVERGAPLGEGVCQHCSYNQLRC